MFDENRMLTISAFIKWVAGEPMSREDLERILGVIQQNDLKVSQIDQQMWAALQVRIRHILNERFGGPKPQ